jgi:hypothetical protein
MSDAQISALLGNYRDFSEALSRASLERLYTALEVESSTRRRRTIITRLIQRIGKLEGEKHKSELLRKHETRWNS